MTEKELEAGFRAVRAAIDASGYGGWVSDDDCKSVALEVLLAAERVREKKEKSGE